MTDTYKYDTFELRIFWNKLKKHNVVMYIYIDNVLVTIVEKYKCRLFGRNDLTFQLTP